MASHYMEHLPVDLAKLMLAEKYDDKYDYHLITDREGSYISGVDKETGEFVDLAGHLDGIPDDLRLDVDEFKFLDDEIKQRDADVDYTLKGFGAMPYLVVISLIVCVAIVAYACYLVLVVGR